MPPLYEVDAYRRELVTDVLEVGRDGARHYAVLADTVLYPEGGGQPADRGWIGEVAVTDVQRHAGQIRHYLARELAPGTMPVRLDWERRFEHMQQHTAQHLLSALAEDRFAWRTTSFHLQEGLCDVELDSDRLPPDRLEQLGEAVASEIRAARPVRPREVEASELGSLAIRTRGLPEGHEGRVRLVEIEGIDLNTCGGTHLRSTAEIELVHLAGSEPMRGGTRLHFVAGGRARRRLAEKEARERELRSLLGVPESQLASAVAARLEQSRDAARRERALLGELAAATAEALVARPGRLVEAHFEARDAAFLQELARRLLAMAPGRVALLTAGHEGAACFVLAAGSESRLDVRARGAEVATLLGGRGGGDARMFQGKAASLARRGEAVAVLVAGLGAG